MKTLHLLILFFGFSVFTIKAQVTDSLEILLKKENNPHKKAVLLFELANEYRLTDSAMAEQKISEARKLINPKDRFLKSYLELAIGNQFYESNYERAQSHFKKGIDLINNPVSKEEEVLMAKQWFNYGTLEQRKDQGDNFLKILLYKCIPLAKKVDDKISLANYYIAVGLVFYNEDYTDKALEYHKIANDLLINEPKNPNTWDLLVKANVYSAEAHLKAGNLKKAKEFIQIADRYLEKYPNSKFLAESYNIKTIYNHLLGNNEEALKQADLGLAALKKYKAPYTLSRISFMKSWILKNMGRYAESKAVLTQLLKEPAASRLADNTQGVYRELASIEEETGNYKEAYKLTLKRFNVMDSFNTKKQYQIISEMEAKYNTSENEKKIAENELEISKKNTYMWILSLLSLLFLSTAVFIYKNFKNKKKISDQKEINLQQKLREKEQQEELKVTKAILDGEERERERVAKDLHDGLGGMLAGVKINLSTWSNNNLEENQYESFHKILNQLDTSVSELRRVARNLMPESLLNFGLEIALKDLCEFYMKEDLKIDFQAINIRKNMPLNLQINIYRIVQELLANAVKHSNASNILVQCSQNENQFFITVEDNGKGLSALDQEKQKSLGLKNLKNRVNYLKGKMEIQSEANEGTSVNIEFNTYAVA